MCKPLRVIIEDLEIWSDQSCYDEAVIFDADEGPFMPRVKAFLQHNVESTDQWLKTFSDSEQPKATSVSSIWAITQVCDDPSHEFHAAPGHAPYIQIVGMRDELKIREINQ